MAFKTESILPRHVAIIMDGNGRWARRQFRPRVFGHRAGADRVRDIVEEAGEMGIEALTLYAFSEENWQRPADEVSALFGLLATYLRKEVAKLHEKNVRLGGIGELSRLPIECQRLLEDAAELTKHNTGLKLTLALSYGGRSEIVTCCRKIAELVADGTLDVKAIDQMVFAQHLSTAHLPDPDLLIRTSGEQRISNFLLWQLAYTELYFTPVHWPEFSKKHFRDAVLAYQTRERRFGKVLIEDSLAIGDSELGTPQTVGDRSC